MQICIISSDLKPLLDTLGLYFQIRDDYANLSSKEVFSFNYTLLAQVVIALTYNSHHSSYIRIWYKILYIPAKATFSNK